MDNYKPAYPTLTDAELRLLPIREIAKDDAVLLMWTTGPMKDKALALIRYWNFTYKTSMFVWNKVSGGRVQSLKGKYSNPSTEEVLIATRG